MVHHYGHVRELATVMLEQKHLEQQLVDTRAKFATGGYPANLQMPLSVRVMWFTKSGIKDLLNLMWTCKPMATSVLTKTESQLLMHCLTPTHLPIPGEWDAFVSQYGRRSHCARHFQCCQELSMGETISSIQDELNTIHILW